MKYFYIEIKNNIGTNFLQTDRPMNKSNMIQTNKDGSKYLGQKYENGSWIDIPKEPEPATITAYNFYRRFPIEIKIAIENSINTGAKVFKQDLQAAMTNQARFEKDNPEMMAGMDYLVKVGIMTEKQKTEILDF
jgi:hypothetical protein